MGGSDDMILGSSETILGWAGGGTAVRSWIRCLITILVLGWNLDKGTLFSVRGRRCAVMVTIWVALFISVLYLNGDF